jgi:hypothetical protein
VKFEITDNVRTLFLEICSGHLVNLSTKLVLTELHGSGTAEQSHGYDSMQHVK